MHAVCRLRACEVWQACSSTAPFQPSVTLALGIIAAPCVVFAVFLAAASKREFMCDSRWTWHMLRIM